MNSPRNTPEQITTHIQTWTISIHSRLAFQTKPQGKQRQMQLNVDTIQTTTNIPGCMMIQQLQQAISQDNYLQQLKDYFIRGWPENRDQIPQDMQTYWTF